MTLEIDNNIYNVEIDKKKTTKNTYIRVKDDLTIYVTCNKYTTDSMIKKIINENIDSIRRMINKTNKKNVYNTKFYYLGKSYDIVYTNYDGIAFGTDKVFISRDFNIDKYLKKEAEKLFLDRLNYWYSNFSKDIPYPTLTIRKMKSRWGVCNVKTKRVTLNLELMKRDVVCLDYVIVHELSHLIHADHSKYFWNLVEENYKDFKKVRKMLKEY